MTDKVIRVNVTSSKSQKVTVSSSKVANEITASPDTSAYYSRLAKNWAIAEGLVENIDYSSKHYAQESKASADMAKTYENATQENYNMFMEASVNANSELQANRDGALADIDEARVVAIDSLNSAKDENISTIESKANEALTNIETNRDETLSSIENSRSSSVSEITSLSNGYISQINTTGKNYDNLTHRNITNCITEIPQRIKLELNNGVLTLKAGSVVIVPYDVEDLTAQYPKGATFLNDNFKVYDTQFADGKFFVWAISQNDIVAATSGAATEQIQNITVNITENAITWGNNSESGTGTATKTYCIYYNTTTNLVGKSTNSTTLVYSNALSLPIAKAVNLVNNTGWKSIDQVFNGMGYIGSTVWVDKGVKGLIPDGRNEDGTFNNIEYTTDKIYMRTFADTVNLTQEALVFTPFNPEFSYFRGTPRGFEITQDGFIYSPYRDEILKGFVALSASSTNGKITNFTPKLPFRAIDYSDKSEVSAWSMPSSKYINLTLGASGSKYVAPANGWYYVRKTAGASYRYLNVGVDGLGWYTSSTSSTDVTELTAFCPICKGHTLFVHYNATGTTSAFRFYYAQGEVS